MKQILQPGTLFILAAVLFLIAGFLSGRPAVYISLGVVFFVLGLAIRKKNAQNTTNR